MNDLVVNSKRMYQRGWNDAKNSRLRTIVLDYSRELEFDVGYGGCGSNRIVPGEKSGRIDRSTLNCDFNPLPAYRIRTTAERHPYKLF